MSRHCCDVTIENLDVMKPFVNVVADVAAFLVQCRDIDQQIIPLDNSR